jgi:hypothetical protein
MIAFPSPEEMELAFKYYGIEIRKDEVIKQLVDGEHVVTKEVAEALRRHDILIEEIEVTKHVSDTEAEGKVKEYFGVEGYLSLSTYYFWVITHNITPPKHKKEVQKLYCQLKKRCPEITYRCETERTSSDCLA